MLDLAVIILTKDENLHIGRCLEKLLPLEPRQTFVVDCLSTDGTQDIARGFAPAFARFGGDLQVVEHPWPGNQAAQFNWALDNLPLAAEWIFRIDADEYLFPDTIEEVRRLLPSVTGEKGASSPTANNGTAADTADARADTAQTETETTKTAAKTVQTAVASGGLPSDATSLSLSLARSFWQMPVRRGVGDIVLTRFFRRGFGRSDDRVMDERIVTASGRDVRLHGAFIDDNLNGPAWWTRKHLDYARREAAAMIAGDLSGRKSRYARLPLFWRALAYFLYRYILRGGFLDGKAGFQWHFFQGLWYRMLVDAEILRLRHTPAPKTRTSHDARYVNARHATFCVLRAHHNKSAECTQ